MIISLPSLFEMFGLIAISFSNICIPTGKVGSNEPTGLLPMNEISLPTIPDNSLLFKCRIFLFS